MGIIPSCLDVCLDAQGSFLRRIYMILFPFISVVFAGRLIARALRFLLGCTCFSLTSIHLVLLLEDAECGRRCIIRPPRTGDRLLQLDTIFLGPALVSECSFSPRWNVCLADVRMIGSGADMITREMEGGPSCIYVLGIPPVGIHPSPVSFHLHLTVLVEPHPWTPLRRNSVMRSQR